MTRQAEPRIFLCHANEDKERVKELYHQLKKAGYHPWLDEEDLLPGQKWRPEIKKIITDPFNFVVVCLSCNSITKRGTVQLEIKWALDVLEEMPEDTIYLIPARLEECKVPQELSDLHWVDLFKACGFERLERALDFEMAQRGVLQALSPITISPPDLTSIEKYVVTNKLERRRLWQIIAGLMKDEKEIIILRDTFVYDLKPSKIYAGNPDQFESLEEVYRVKRNLLNRLRRNPELRQFLSH